MKISVDDQELFTLTDTQKNVIMNDVLSDEFDADMKRRLQWIIAEKYNRCFERLKKEWEPKLAERGIASIPTNKDAFAELIFTQPDYKNRNQRESEAV